MIGSATKLVLESGDPQGESVVGRDGDRLEGGDPGHKRVDGIDENRHAFA